MTYPHQLMRVILLEQVYRGGKINRGDAYRTYWYSGKLS
ncbi:23S rRNA (pseudouridine(1915)-N(3))-methyltransferase RlmH [Cohnella terricola]|uniref:23S rRNA (Pseudouridine(1915)-N(3))-methyltransferase RlmH n=1 Tax=Cohnella terricola TaxID=1289167 RepID=A0A559IV90_9BACL|nr:23S rRNA (pseudouridine(1915)-N(3))-methyltransferase RlmH [Cohnella terricola]